jgi:hypothetical protein
VAAIGVFRAEALHGEDLETEDCCTANNVSSL